MKTIPPTEGHTEDHASPVVGWASPHPVHRPQTCSPWCTNRTHFTARPTTSEWCIAGGCSMQRHVCIILCADSVAKSLSQRNTGCIRQVVIICS